MKYPEFSDTIGLFTPCEILQTPQLPFCCGIDNSSRDCCEGLASVSGSATSAFTMPMPNYIFATPASQLTTASSTLTVYETITASSTSESSACVNSEICPKSHSTAIAASIGGLLGIAIVTIIAQSIIFRRKYRSRPAAREVSHEPMARMDGAVPERALLENTIPIGYQVASQRAELQGTVLS